MEEVGRRSAWFGDASASLSSSSSFPIYLLSIFTAILKVPSAGKFYAMSGGIQENESGEFVVAEREKYIIEDPRIRKVGCGEVNGWILRYARG